MKLPAQRIFPEVRMIHWGKLSKAGLINKDKSVVSWSYVNPLIRDKMMTELEAKQLILIEVLFSEKPRKDLIGRLVNYLSKKPKETTMHLIEAHL